jgi:hypothetical protein
VCGSYASCASAGGEQPVETRGGALDARSAEFTGHRIKKAVKPRQKRRLVRWAQEAYQMTERRAIGVVRMWRSSCRYGGRARSQQVLRQRLKQVAATHVRYGYRRLTVLLRREGWPVNAKASVSNVEGNKD